MKIVRIVLTLALALSPVLFAQSSPSPEALLKAAIDREVVDRDLDGAVAQYQNIVTRFPANRAVASKALLRLGGVYERQGKSDALAMYQRIVAEYADTGATATAARARLAVLQDAASGPFKARNLDDYIKFEDTGNIINMSDDGKSLAYVVQDPDKTTLHVRDLSNGNERLSVRLDAAGKGGSAGFLAWSVDGQRLATRVCPRGGSAREDVLCAWQVLTVATREVRTVGHSATGGWSYWAPNGKWLAFVNQATKDGPREIHLASMGPGTADVVSLAQGVQSPSQLRWSPDQLRWSPDSTRLAFVSSEGAGLAIRVVTVATREAQSIPLTKPTPTSQTTLVDWMPNDEIGFEQTGAGGRDIFLVKASGGTPRKVCEGRAGGDGCGGFSPDGKLIVVNKFESGGGHIALRDTAALTERSLTPEAVKEEFVSFSPDSRLIAFTSNRDGRYAVYVVPTDRIPVANPVRVAPLDSLDGRGVTRLAWGAAGLVLDLGDYRWNLYRIDLDPRTKKPTGAPSCLTQDSRLNLEPFVSPDGRQIAYETRGPQGGLALMDANGVRERVIKAVPQAKSGSIKLLGWRSADELLYAEAGSARNLLLFESPKQLMVLNITTGATRTVGSPVTGRLLALAGNDVLTRSRSNNQSVISLQPIAGGAGRVMLIGDFDLGVALAPDGRWLAYSVTRSGAPNPAEIRLRSVDGGTDRVLARFPDNFDGWLIPNAFSPDGKYLLYHDGAGAARIMNVETAESWPAFTEAPTGLDAGVTEGTWSPDGSFTVVGELVSWKSYRAFEGITYEAVTKFVAGKR